MEKQKICFFLPNLNAGGAEKVTVNFANNLISNYFVDIVLLQECGEYLDDLHESVHRINLNASRAGLSISKFRQYIKTNHPAIIISEIEHLNMIAAISTFGLKHKPKVIATLHSDPTNRYKYNKGLNQIAVRTLEKILYKNMDFIITVSEGIKKQVLSLYKPNPNKVSTIYNPIFSKALSELAAAPLPTLEFKSPSWPFILSVGRLNEAKNQLLLIDAFSMIANTYNLNLVIVGDGELKSTLQNRIDYHHLKNRVLLIGFDANPYKYMNNCAVFVLSSNYEGFGNVLVEALACGRPIVSTDCKSGPREILDGGKYGQLVPVKDAHALSEGIIKALNSPFNPAILKERASYFSVERSSNELINIINNLLGDPK